MSDCKPYRIILVGNPGVGKSTLASTFLRKTKVFKSGLSVGAGYTKEVKFNPMPDGNFIADTPGLADVKLRKKAAEAITIALRKPTTTDKKLAIHVIVFVVRLESCRILPQDLVTIKTVMEAIPAHNGILPQYNVVVNRCTNKQRRKIFEFKSEFLLAFKEAFKEEISTPATITFVGEDEEAADEDHKMLTETSGVFCNEVLNVVAGDEKGPLPVKDLYPKFARTVYEVGKIEDVNPSEYDKQLENLSSQLADLAIQNKNLTDRLAEDRKNYDKIVKQAAADREANKKELERQERRYEDLEKRSRGPKWYNFIPFIGPLL